MYFAKKVGHNRIWRVGLYEPLHTRAVNHTGVAVTDLGSVSESTKPQTRNRAGRAGSRDAPTDAAQRSKKEHVYTERPLDSKVVTKGHEEYSPRRGQVPTGVVVSRFHRGNHERRPVNTDVEVLEERQPQSYRASPPRRKHGQPPPKS
jgi:hypothetical protein